MLHSLLLGLESAGGVVTVLLLAAFLMASARALFDEGGVVVLWSPEQVPFYEARAARESWPHKVLVALDIFLNVAALGGMQGETISTHSYIAATERKLWGRALTWWLNLIQPLHGLKAASGDLERASAETARMQKLLGLTCRTV